MKNTKKYALAAILSFSVFAASIAAPPAFAAPKGNGIALLVNGNAITGSDITERVAFLRLQHRSGNLEQIARQDLTDEVLRRQEIRKHNITVSQADIDKAYAGFAASNNISVDQLNQIMNQSGVTPAHFKAYIRDQMGWGRLVSARFQAESAVSPRDAVQRMLKNGGKKPSLNEYLLQQVILVVPANRRGAILGRRMSEANALRSKVNGCDNLHTITKGSMDTTVRTLGRFLEPQIPAEWERAVRATAIGKATPAQATQRGVEFLVVCSMQKATDDRVAQLVYSMQDSSKSAERGAALEKKYMQELRAAATIQKP
ncbi:MAG: peptidylprolyl isomerase [Candidatus Tokpelaia sp.]|nr:MAG: peptidylprolyl isomerase [Candidatus Tokpelaia sp.]KAA6207642.1 MAG: peptidylprolyl isomerase [Candidatus Tokpelaia sp.]